MLFGLIRTQREVERWKNHYKAAATRITELEKTVTRFEELAVEQNEALSLANSARSHAELRLDDIQSRLVTVLRVVKECGVEE